MDTVKAKQAADEIIHIFLTKGGENYAGEEITQLEHASQAAILAAEEGHDNEVMIAAFLHDIGHLISEDTMHGFGAADHEAAGADYLRARGFSDKIAELVKSHVDAKRYLCYANSHYYDHLSEASKTTLLYQGGPMTKQEAEAFDKNPLRNLILKMRTWDERAKEKHKSLPNLNHYRQLMEMHLLQTL